MHTRFSVIIPVYNVAPYLRECLDSVLAQTFTDWEAICVDDGSTDESGVILDEYGKKDARFRVIHQENAGVSAARNAALGVANGEWILFLDADDVWSQSCLSTIVLVSARYQDAELIRFGQINFVDRLEFKDDVPLSVRCVDISCEIRMGDFVDTLFWGYAYRKGVIGSRRFPPYKRGEDRVFLNGIQLFSASRIYAVDRVLYGYRQRATSQMHSKPSAQVIIDEMNHRCDIVKMIEASSKSVKYTGSHWLEGYFTKVVGRLIADMPAVERDLIWREWIRCVREMKGANGISFHTRCVYAICCGVPCRFVWWSLCCAWPWYGAHGILPRVMRKVLRYVH